jgi:GNAT superfamily N-acetyltransferase
VVGPGSIRAARPEDRAAVLELLAAQMAEHAIPLEAHRLARAVDGALADLGAPAPRALILVAERAGVAAERASEILGVAYVAFTWTIEHGGRTSWLEELYVRPDHRTGGLGTQLLRAAISAARAHGAAAVDLEVESDHARVEGLYLREGFQRRTRSRWVLFL